MVEKIIVVVVVAAAVIFALRSLVRTLKGDGKGGSSCSGCTHRSSCGTLLDDPAANDKS